MWWIFVLSIIRIESNNLQIQELQNEENWLKNELITIQNYKIKQEVVIEELKDELDIKESQLIDQNNRILRMWKQFTMKV